MKGGMELHGLKDHEITILVNDTTKYLNQKFHYLPLPQCLRTIVASAITGSLIKQGLRIDSAVKVNK